MSITAAYDERQVMKTRVLDSLTADNLLIEATKKLVWLQQQDRWVKELPKRFPPILWFGNALSSKPVVLTLAPNPSRREYLRDSSQQALDKIHATNDESQLSYLEPPNNRFRLLNADESLRKVLVDRRLRDELVQGYNSYFYGNPYRRWFGCDKEDSYNAEGFLRGLGASYYDVEMLPFQAIHIDLLPFATLSDFNRLKPQAEADLFKTGWASHFVISLVRLFRPMVVVVFGKSNVKHFAEHINASMSSLPWVSFPGARYQLGEAEELGVRVVGLSVNLGNPKGFDSTGLQHFGRHVGKQLGL